MAWFKRLLPSFLFISSYAILGYCALIAIIGLTAQLTQVWPHDPWESAVVVEGWRASQNMPVYEGKEIGHATLMYGPAQPYLLGIAFKVLPISKHVPQAISLLCAGGLLGLLIMALRPYCSRICIGLIGLSFIAIENRVFYFTQARPDLIAWLLGFAGLILLYRYFSNPKLWIYLAGVFLIVVAFTFKQTAAMLALVPPVALALEQEPKRPLKQYIMSLGPLAVVFFLIGAISILTPNLHYYMIVVPRGYSISWVFALKCFWTTIAAAPCLWYAAGHAATMVKGLGGETRRRLLWWYAVVIVTLPLAVVTLAKPGGVANSLLPAWVAILGACWHLLAARGVTNTRLATATLQQAAQVFLLSLCISLTLMPSLKLIHQSIGHQSRTRGERTQRYKEVIEKVRQLNGIVYAPEDPLIVLKAKGLPTRSLQLEYDATFFPSALPAYLKQELSRADYIVDLLGERGHHHISSDNLLSMGFMQIWSNGNYTLWSKQDVTR